MAAVADVILNVDAKGAAAELNKVDTAAKGLNGTFNTLKATIAALGIGLAAKAILDVGNESEASKNKLKALTAQYGELNQATQSVDRVQKLLGMSAIEARDSYAQLYGSLRGTGLSAEQLEVLFVGLNKAAKLSGGGAQEAQAGIMQLKQAFSSGTLSGDELRSVLENMPAFAQAVAKETDKLGITSNATAADLKKLGGEGKLTSDILFNAAKNLAMAQAPGPTTTEKLAAAFKNLKERIAEAFGPAAIALATQFSAAIRVVGDWFAKNQGVIAAVAKVFLDLVKTFGPLAVGIFTVVKAYEAWKAISMAVAATQAFITALSGPQGIAMVAAAAVAAGVAYTTLNGVLKGTADEVARQKNEAAGADAEFKKIATSVDPLPNKTKAAADATTEYAAQLTTAAEQAKNGQLAIEGQIASLERGASITSSRYEAELAFNNLQGQQLERAYELAGSEQERLNIAVQIFQNAVQAAKIEYNQALERINLEKQKLELQHQSQQLKLAEIEAEGKRAQITEKDAAKRAEIVQRTKEALAAQQEVINQSGQAAQAQQQIAQYQKQTADAQYQSKVLSAQTALEQKLISDKIGLSQQDAARLSSSLSQSASQSSSLSSATGQVASNASNAASMFIKVESNARAAANSINAAAAAQERLNAARARGGGGGGGGAEGAAAGAYWKGGFKAFAKGGMVNKPTLGLIGEGGEPEYIIPESKASGFAANYLMGARGSSAIPAFAKGGYVGPGSANVSIQTGPVTQMNGTNFVTTQDLSRAVQAGVDQTLALLAGDINVRAGLGLI